MSRRSTAHLPRCLSRSVYTATADQVQRLVDGLDVETPLAWAQELVPDHVPDRETWAHTGPG